MADFRRELEAYTGHSWYEFFRDWLYGPGLTDWAVDNVSVQPPPLCAKPELCGWWKRHIARKVGPNQLGQADGLTRVVVILRQKGPINEANDARLFHEGLPRLPDPHSHRAARLQL